MISYGRHKIDSKDIKNVIKALKSDYLTSGPRVKEFENKLNKKFGGKFCTAVSNGTSALHLLGKALNWKKNDLIATTPISFIATSNCIVNNNASPVFIDIEKKTYTIDLDKLENKLKKKKFKAVIAVDYA
jgi:dTDP-4-amino-4,6-dideoxygalactose transaminase